jgi:hypothetical protein
MQADMETTVVAVTKAALQQRTAAVTVTVTATLMQP